MATKPKKIPSAPSRYLVDQIDQIVESLAALTQKAANDAVRIELRNARQHAEMAMVLAGDWVPCLHLTEDEERALLEAIEDMHGTIEDPAPKILVSVVDDAYLMVRCANRAAPWAAKWEWLVESNSTGDESEGVEFHVRGSYPR